MDLGSFMEFLGLTDADVAQAVSRDRSTISRIRRKKVIPDAQTLLKLNEWAKELARKKRLRRSKRLTWDYLLTDEVRAA